jgi:hypothetical protein
LKCHPNNKQKRNCGGGAKAIAGRQRRIFDGDCDQGRANHALLIVGYDQEEIVVEDDDSNTTTTTKKKTTVRYWIARNSRASDQGCTGGNPLLAFFNIHHYGLVPWDEYPYTMNVQHHPRIRPKPF